MTDRAQQARRSDCEAAGVRRRRRREDGVARADREGRRCGPGARAAGVCRGADDGLRGRRVDGRAGWRAQRRALEPPEWLSRSAVGDAGRAHRLGDPEAQKGLVLPGLPGAEAAGREGADGGDPSRASRPRDPSAEQSMSADIDGEAYVHGISTRAVDDLVKAMGGSGVSKSQVSRLCVELDAEVQAFLTRPIEGQWPYLCATPRGRPRGDPGGSTRRTSSRAGTDGSSAWRR